MPMTLSNLFLKTKQYNDVGCLLLMSLDRVTRDRRKCPVSLIERGGSPGSGKSLCEDLSLRPPRPRWGSRDGPLTNTSRNRCARKPRSLEVLVTALLCGSDLTAHLHLSTRNHAERGGSGSQAGGGLAAAWRCQGKVGAVTATDAESKGGQDVGLVQPCGAGWSWSPHSDLVCVSRTVLGTVNKGLTQIIKMAVAFHPIPRLEPAWTPESMDKEAQGPWEQP